MKLFEKRSLLRLVVVVLAGAGAVLAARHYRESRLPPRAPDRVQRQGVTRIRQLLDRVARTPFGASERGGLLIAEIRRLLDSGQVVFVTGLGVVARYVEVRLGSDRLLIDTFRFGTGVPPDERVSLPDDGRLARAVFHEGVHAIRTSGHCLEEECDAFVAGYEAHAALSGMPLPGPLLLDGRSVAGYVRLHYPELSRNPRYQPVGASQRRLAERAGLPPP